MSKPFDATLKELLERDPPGWLALAGYPGCEAVLIDADVSTVTAASDKVIQVRGNPDWLLDINFQRGPDSSLLQRSHLYNAVLSYRQELLVRSLIVLLSPKANLSNLTGTYEESFPGEPPHVCFRYQVIRVWELPVERVLSGSVMLLPLAPISAVSEVELPGVVSRMKTRFDSEIEAAQRRELWTTAYVLMGLRFHRPMIDRLLKEVMAMEESTTYQGIIEEGMARGKIVATREVLLFQGEERFGPPPESIRHRIDALRNLQELHRLLHRVLSVSSWEELLSLPTS
jgi:predicted transposase YdaD